MSQENNPKNISAWIWLLFMLLGFVGVLPAIFAFGIAKKGGFVRRHSGSVINLWISELVYTILILLTLWFVFTTYWYDPVRQSSVQYFQQATGLDLPTISIWLLQNFDSIRSAYKSFSWSAVIFSFQVVFFLLYLPHVFYCLRGATKAHRGEYYKPLIAIPFFH